MSKEERKLPQYCRDHPRDKTYRSFRPNEGRFVDNNRAFLCFRCLNRNARWLASKKTAKESTAELELLRELNRAGKKFEQQWPLGEFKFDYAFPDNKVLLELDGSCHRFRSQQAHDRKKDEAARQQGWRVIRVQNGPGLLHRVAMALAGS